MRTTRAVIYLLFMPSLAFAYIDPGSGMLLIQGLIAFLGACIAFIKNPFEKIKKIFGIKNK
ncbi:hypothetical protein ACO0K0_18890 [Undibacterium sp. SXout11W]|uniref:hypothetical protein n=1 Tax=Undibacterium sp. SXout11W TaxID=3413050 RepID=UPI003BF21F49